MIEHFLHDDRGAEDTLLSIRHLIEVIRELEQEYGD